MNLIIAHLYPKLMNIYSDIGNIICLKKRCQWREIKVKVVPIEVGDKFNWQKYDLVFGGGGQDRQQEIVSQDLQKKKKELNQAVEQGIPVLTTCGTYQLFGHYFKTYEGKLIKGISVFDAYTIASHQRKIGNILIELNNSAISHQPSAISQFLVGFENHSGNTFITNSVKTTSDNQNTSEVKSSNTSEVTINNQQSTIPLGTVIKGFGNNGQDKTEGAIYKNCLGTYLHGPILPKNPHLADWLILKALQRKYNKKAILKPLNDTLEWQTHKAAIKLTHQTKKSFF